MYNLKTYLRNVYELEASVYQQEQCIQNIQNRLSSLPTVEPATPKNTPGILYCLLYAVPMAIVGALLLNGGSFLSVAAAVFLLFGAGIMLLAGIVCIPKDNSEQNRDKNNYIRELSQYRNGQVVKKALEADLPALRNKLSETQNLLRSYYAKGVLHPNYQNFVAVAYLLDCIDTGRYTKLDGPDGAYNQFELEVRMDRISSQLDTVIDKLDQIRQNQYSLYAAITQANRTNEFMFQRLDGYCRNLDTLNVNTAQIRQSLNIANHTAELTRKEIAYRNYLDHGSNYSY